MYGAPEFKDGVSILGNIKKVAKAAKDTAADGLDRLKNLNLFSSTESCKEYYNHTPALAPYFKGTSNP